MLKTLTDLLVDHSFTLEEVEEHLLDPIDDLKNILDGLVIMGKINKTGKYYHGVDVKIEKKITQRSGSVDDFDYPDWVDNKKSQVDFWLSTEAPLLPHAKTFLWWDYIESNTGKTVYDALHSSVIKHEYTLRPNMESKYNEVQFHESISTSRGIAFTVIDGGKFEVYWWDSKGTRLNKQFPDYEGLKKWTIQNL